MNRVLYVVDGVGLIASCAVALELLGPGQLGAVGDWALLVAVTLLAIAVWLVVFHSLLRALGRTPPSQS